MITKYKIYNESVKSLLVGPTMEDAWESFGFDSFDDPEKFFSYLIDGMKIHEQTKFPNSIFWENHGIIIFQIDKKFDCLYVECFKIWTIFNKIFGLSFTEIKSFIYKMVRKYRVDVILTESSKIYFKKTFILRKPFDDKCILPGVTII